MANGRTLRIFEIENDTVILQEQAPGRPTYTIPKEWLARGMKEGDIIRATEEMPGVVRFRGIANPNWLEDPAEDLAPKTGPALDEEPLEVPGDTLVVSDNTATWTNVDEGDQLPPENDITGE
jgi:hypothetical protein